MKNLGKTIDRILKVDPSLEGKLTPIKNKWKKSPSKTMNYWKELLTLLNAPSLMSHPKRSEIKDLIVPKRVIKRSHLHSFEDVIPADKILGVIPENIADAIRRHDRQSINLSKMIMEADLTRNAELKKENSRKEVILDINSKKIWLTLKDLFQLWAKTNLSIKKDKSLLVVVETPFSVPPVIVGPGIVKMDEHTLQQFLQYLGYTPPEEEN